MQDLRSAFLETPSPITGQSLECKASALSRAVTEVQNPDDGIDDSLSDVESQDSLDLNDGPPVIKARPYQKEMLEESLKRNIIVAMDTGSGKTQIAVMRMQHELEHMFSNQVINYNLSFRNPADSFEIIWFLAPTVALSAQQFGYISSQITSVQSKFLSGADGVDRWTAQSHWDAVLKNIKIVVSTYQILLDALTHGFVLMESLALIHAGARIMSLFYHRRKGAGLSVPNILGMTASPIMKTNPQGLAIIESTLDAICRTPIKHRAELRLEVKLPLLLRVQYQKPLLDSNKAIQSLSLAYVNLDIEKDPYFAKLSKDKSEQGQNNLARVRLSGKTSCCDQIKSFCTTAKTILQDLGPWAANYYVAQVISKIGKIASGSKGFPHGWDTANAENKYLIKALQGVETSPTHFSLNDVQSVSDKVGKLVEILIQEEAGFSGIVFVQERATAAVLSHLLSVHPTIRGRFKVGTIVGSSTHKYRARNLSELIDLDEQKHVLSDFKSGKIKLAVATSVLEEGIDVPACNLVICFQTPANLKSFVQRRGRARHRDSKLVLLVDSADKKLTGWEQLENDMRNMYEDDMRNLQEYLVHEDAEEHDGRIFQVTSTNAVLDLDNSVAHLYHFCAKLPPQAYVDRRPEFICFSEGAAIRAKVILPLSVDESVRVAESQRSWLSEKNAMKDAAFQSYVALHKNGLVNDNLLPTVGNEIVPDDLRTSSDARSSLESVHEQLNPWVYIAQAWKTDPVIHQYIITFQSLEVAILIPAHLQQMPPFKLYWDAQTEFSLDITMRTGRISSEMRSKALDDTWALLQTAFGTRFTIERKPLVLQFVANEHLSQMMGTEDVQISRINETTGLIRDKLCPSVAYIFKEFLATKPDIGLVQCPYDGYQDSEESAHLSLERLHRRSDFINRVALSSPAASKKPYATVLPAITCSASSEDNYQRLEFLGDTVLKLCTSIELMAKYPLWHEGYLTMLKGRIVSNSSLFAAAILTGLDRFIITKVFNGHKWRPVYVDSLETCSHVDSKREMSSKIPADVVEALVGASMVDGGIPKSLRCLKTFIPQLDWQPLEIRRSALFQRASNIELPATLQPLESLIGYQFQKKGLLIEALTHASCISGSASLERLEFLGDAILDHLVVQALWTYDLSHIKLHLMRTALVNADVLAFLCMEWHTEQEVIDLENNTPRPRQVALPLWKFMRHTSPPIGLEQHATAERHSILAPQIRRILQTGDHYPWALLARLRAQKLYSDLVEALIGAVWVDSGAFEACAAVAERIGIFPVMRRLLDDDVQVLNPKEELGILAVSETVQYVVSRPAAVPDADDETPTSTGLRCAVLVGERRVVEVEHGVSTLEVETRAAEEAVRILKREKVQAAGAGAGAGVGAQGKDDGEGSVDVEMGDA
ncbi:RNase3 domain-containing protein [Diplocarpon rosae]|nr:RNase3 domain-containing protein [Diplocarpon rosae]